MSGLATDRWRLIRPGNFASGISFAGMRYGKRVIIVMPESAPQIKFERTRSFGAEIRTYDIATDHLTGQRDALTRQIAEEENAVQAIALRRPTRDCWQRSGRLGDRRRTAAHGALSIALSLPSEREEV